MQRGEKLRYVNTLTGTFVILALLLTLIGVFFVAGAQRWFSPNKQLLILLPEEGAHGLREEADVEILGTIAGQVQRIYIDPQERMVAELSIEPGFYQFVRRDSKVIIRHTISLVGGIFMEITRGRGAELPVDQPVLTADTEKDIKTVLTEILASVESATLPTLQEYTKLAAELRDPQGPVQTLLGKANRIATTLDQGQGTLPMLLNDETLAKSLLQTMHKLNASLAQLEKVLQTAEETGSKLGTVAASFDQQLQPVSGLLEQTGQILHNLQRASDPLPQASQNLSQELQALPGLLLQTQTTLQEIERLTVGIQRHWLVRDYIDKDELPLRIPIEEISGEGQKQ